MNYPISSNLLLMPAASLKNKKQIAKYNITYNIMKKTRQACKRKDQKQHFLEERMLFCWNLHCFYMIILLPPTDFFCSMPIIFIYSLWEQRTLFSTNIHIKLFSSSLLLAFVPVRWGTAQYKPVFHWIMLLLPNYTTNKTTLFYYSEIIILLQKWKHVAVNFPTEL